MIGDKIMFTISQKQLDAIDSKQTQVEYFKTSFEYKNTKVPKNSICRFIGFDNNQHCYKIITRTGKTIELKLKGRMIGKMEDCLVADKYQLSDKERLNYLQNKMINGLYNTFHNGIYDESDFTDAERDELETLQQKLSKDGDDNFESC